MDLRIAIRSGCFWPGIGLVLAKMMKAAKEIRPDDKKRGAAPAGGRAAAGLLADGLGGAVVCWRLLAFLGAGDARREGPPPGRWPAGDGLLGGCWWSAGGGLGGQ